jgi:DNA uptake protein ComE-like DNA-binding protein
MKTTMAALAVLLLSFAGAGLAGAQTPGAVDVLNPNTAKAEQMAALPHMTAPLAQSVVAGRPYKNTAALNAVLAKSLSATDVTEVNVRLFVPINLNTATDEEIALVPGMSRRMIREFGEYRPYKDIEQFRREIGKYVGAQEVARFESYVTLK